MEDDDLGILEKPKKVERKNQEPKKIELKPKIEDKKEKSYCGFAIASFVLSLCFFIPVINLLTSLLAIIFGFIAISRIKKDPHLKGKGLAIFGIIFGFIILILVLVLFSLVISFFYGAFKDIEAGNLPGGLSYISGVGGNITTGQITPACFISAPLSCSEVSLNNNQLSLSLKGDVEYATVKLITVNNKPCVTTKPELTSIKQGEIITCKTLFVDPGSVFKGIITLDYNIEGGAPRTLRGEFSGTAT